MITIPQKPIVSKFPLILRDVNLVTDFQPGEILMDYNNNELYYMNPKTLECESLSREIYNKILAANAENTLILLYNRDKILPKPPKDEILPKLNDRIYKAKKIIYTENAEKKLKEFEDIIKNKYVCLAKSPYSFTDNDDENEENTSMTITDISVSNGVGFVVVYTSGVMLMPGLTSSPQAERIDVDKNGNIIGME